MAGPMSRARPAATRGGESRRAAIRPIAAVAALVAALAALLPAGAPVAAETPTHRLTLIGTTTEPARSGTAARQTACLLRFSLRRVATSPWNRSADLTLEFADPRAGRRGSLHGTLRLDLDDTGRTARTMRVDGIGCDELRPLNLRFVCATDNGRCPSGTRIRLRNFDRLEIAENTLAFD